jgi:CDP-paratose 2-epimerase
VGSEVCAFFASPGCQVHGVDNNQRAGFFGPSPRIAEVYNIGGGKANSCSILEAFELVQSLTGRPQIHTYVDEARRGDHICYYSDLRKIRAHYPTWTITRTLPETIREIVDNWQECIVAS